MEKANLLTNFNNEIELVHAATNKSISEDYFVSFKASGQ